MAQIFENSFITISAAISRNDTDSLFFNDKRHFSSLKSYAGQAKDGSPYTIHSRIPFGYHPADGTGANPSPEKYPLMTRAWAYQERLLAPRILYFGEELSWECRTTSACECSGRSYGIKQDHSLSLLPGFSTEELYLQWQNMVKEFTWLQLSFEEDRLPAFSGLAQQYQQRLKSEYLAGLWRENLVADLMWFAYPNRGNEAQRYSTKKPKKWLAPSWSWASIEGPILFSKDYNIAKAQVGAENVTSWIDIISADCPASSLDPMGTVAEGQLTIKGSGRPARLKHGENCEGDNTRHFTVKRTGINSIYSCSNFTVDGKGVNVDYDLIEHGLMKPNSEMSIYCLYIAGMSSTQRTFVPSQGDYILRPVYKVWSLLLHCVDGGNYERVGFQFSEHLNVGEQFRDSLHECTITIV
jgi:hypothetical protein